MRLIGLFIFFISMFCSGQLLSESRKNYTKAVDSKEICAKMMSSLEDSEAAVYIAYLGTYQTIWANHASNPISKWKTFKKGKENIEKAVKVKPNDIEVRLLRLGVQMHAPRFLGYYKNINEDKSFVVKNQHNISDPELKSLIKTVLQ